jgi:hypothetical protein
MPNRGTPHKTSRRWRLAAGLATVLVTAALATAACSASDNSSPTSGSVADGRGAAGDGFQGEKAAPQAVPGPADAGDAAGAPAAPAEPNAQQAPDVKIAPNERSIIYTGSITVAVDDVRSAADKAGVIATGAGGFVGADKRSLLDGHAEAQLVLRVPAAGYSSALDALGKLGTEEARSGAQEDVTEAVVDLDARIQSQQASVNRTRALLAKANTIGEIVSVESELTKREADLASLQARKRSLADRVDLSTITVFLHSRETPPPTPVEPDSGFVAGLKSGWHAFVSSVKVLLTILGALTPFVIAIGVPLWLLFWWLRRRRDTAVRPLAVSATHGIPVAPPASESPAAPPVSQAGE